MYAMLVNELPTTGINAMNKVDADRKIDMLQDDVDTAGGTLPQYMKKNIEKYTGRAIGAGAAAPDAAPASTTSLEDELVKKHAAR